MSLHLIRSGAVHQLSEYIVNVYLFHLHRTFTHYLCIATTWVRIDQQILRVNAEITDANNIGRSCIYPETAGTAGFKCYRIITLCIVSMNRRRLVVQGITVTKVPFISDNVLGIHRRKMEGINAIVTYLNTCNRRQLSVHGNINGIGAGTSLLVCNEYMV